MLSTQDFAQQVWLSLENIRERLAVVETEVRHLREDVAGLEESFRDHLAAHQQSSGPPGEPPDNGTVVTVKLGRKLVGGSTAAGAAAALAGLAKALGWW